MVTTARKQENGHKEVIGNVTNDAEDIIAYEDPYSVDVTITGATSLLFHRWSDDAVEAKAKAAKGSKAKKTDDVDSYVWRNDKGELCLPGEYVRMAAVNAGRRRQDPSSPRKSALDLCKAGIVTENELSVLRNADGKTMKDWDFLDRRRVVVQRNGITRQRPGFVEGWQASFTFLVTLPEYISPAFLYDLLNLAGRTVGVGDFRPTFGRFNVTGYARR